MFTLLSCQETGIKPADIITTMFSQYGFARQIVKDNMTVTMMVPPGAKVHGYETTSRDIEAIMNARLFIHISEATDTWIAGVRSILESDVIIPNLSKRPFLKKSLPPIRNTRFYTQKAIMIGLMLGTSAALLSPFHRVCARNAHGFRTTSDRHSFRHRGIRSDQISFQQSKRQQ